RDFSSPHFFCHVTAPPEIYTLSLHDALPISRDQPGRVRAGGVRPRVPLRLARDPRQGGADAARARVRQPPQRVRALLDAQPGDRSEEHTSELQSRENLVCRLLLEKKKKQN